MLRRIGVVNPKSFTGVPRLAPPINVPCPSVRHYGAPVRSQAACDFAGYVGVEERVDWSVIAHPAADAQLAQYGSYSGDLSRVIGLFR